MLEDNQEETEETPWKEELLEGKGRKKKKRVMHPNSLKALESRSKFQKNDPATGFKDPRINRKGAPDTTAAMRSLIKQIGADLLAISEERNGRKRTRLKSRIVKKIEEMYDSSNPADSVAILKAGWPGLLGEDTGDGKPKEMVLKIVYENKRAPVIDDEIEEGLVLAPGQEGGGVDVGGSNIIMAPTPQASWGPSVVQHEIETPAAWKEDNLAYPIQVPPDAFYCVLCKDFRTGPANISIEAGGWICQTH
jgi:hypothetical protein